MSNNFARKIYKNFFIVPPFSVRPKIFKCGKSLLQQKTATKHFKLKLPFYRVLFSCYCFIFYKLILL